MKLHLSGCVAINLDPWKRGFLVVENFEKIVQKNYCYYANAMLI